MSAVNQLLVLVWIVCIASFLPISNSIDEQTSNSAVCRKILSKGA